jgi:hypothetical protein
LVIDPEAKGLEAVYAVIPEMDLGVMAELVALEHSTGGKKRILVPFCWNRGTADARLNEAETPAGGKA